MQKTLHISLRELRSLAGAPWAYWMFAAALLVTGYGFAWSPATYLETSLRGFFSMASLAALLLAPALGVRLLTRELEHGSMELLLTAPVREREIVLGKFLAGLGALSVLWLVTLTYGGLLAWYGTPDWGPVLGGYVGLILVSAVFLGLSLFAAALTASPVLGFVLSTLFSLAVWYVDLAAEYAAVDGMSHLSLARHFTELTRGVLDTSAVVYCLSLAALSLFLAMRLIEMRRWAR